MSKMLNFSCRQKKKSAKQAPVVKYKLLYKFTPGLKAERTESAFEWQWGGGRRSAHTSRHIERAVTSSSSSPFKQKRATSQWPLRPEFSLLSCPLGNNSTRTQVTAAGWCQNKTFQALTEHAGWQYLADFIEKLILFPRLLQATEAASHGGGGHTMQAPPSGRLGGKRPEADIFRLPPEWFRLRLLCLGLTGLYSPCLRPRLPARPLLTSPHMLPPCPPPGKASAELLVARAGVGLYTAPHVYERDAHCIFMTKAHSWFHREANIPSFKRAAA